MSNGSPRDVSETEVIGNWKKFIIPTLLLVIVIGVIFLSNMSDNWFTSQKITKYKISGTNLSDSSKFFDIAKEISFNKSKDSVLLKLIENKIEEVPYVKKCVSSFSSYDKVNIEIIEREPYVFFHTTNGLQYLDAEGFLLPYGAFNNYSNLIIVSGFTSEDTLLLNDALSIVKKLELNDKLSSVVSELRYIDEKKGFELIGLFDDNIVYFGLDKNTENKIEKLKLLYSNESAKLILKENSIVDLRWYNRVILSEK